MNAVKLALLAIVAVLLFLVVLDRGNAARREAEVYARLSELASTTLQLAQEMKALRQQGVAVRSAGAATAAVADGRDGKPRLGTNFLQPYDSSFYHPEWLGGTWMDFNASPKGLNALIDNDATQSAVEGLANDSLCGASPLTPELWSENLATSCVISDDYKTYTFTLRPGVMWQRPAIASQPSYAWLAKDVPLTSKDFAFYLQMAKDPTVECPQLKSYYDDLESWATPDDLTLVLHWKKKLYTSLSSSLALTPMPSHIYSCDRDGSTLPADRLGPTMNQHWFDQARQYVGVGAYIMDAWEPDKVIRFRRNPAYWGAGLHFERIRWDGETKLPDPQLVSFKNGQVQSHGLAPNQWKSEIVDHKEPRFTAIDPANPKAGRQGELGWERVRGSSYSYLGWNQRLPLFADKRVRWALSHAFPQQRIIDEAYFGLGRPQTSPVHPDSVYSNRDLKPVAFDLEQAKALLAEAGWRDSDNDGWLDKVIDGKRTALRFSLKYSANRPEWDASLLIYRNVLRTIGIDLEPVSLEWKELIRVYEDKDFQAVAGGWQMPLEVDFEQVWGSKSADEPRSSNHIGFKNAKVDELSDVLRSEFDLNRRIAVAKEIQAIIYAEQPYTFFRSSESIFVWQNRRPVGDTTTERWLDGVTYGLDHYHPLKSRSPLRWHFAAP